MNELIGQFLLQHDRTAYHSAVVLLAMIISIAALSVCHRKKTVQSQLFRQPLIMAYFYIGLLSCALDLIPSQYSHISAIYIQLFACLLCTILLINSSIPWTRQASFWVPASMVMLICSFFAASSGFWLLVLLGLFSLLCYGALLVVYSIAYRHSRNFGYMFYTVAVAMLCIASLIHIWLAFQGKLELAAELFAAISVCGFCLTGVGYILVLEYKEQRKLARLVIRDPLTELLNRRGMDEAFYKANTPQRHWSLLVIDIDHFKRINDQFGHDAGDVVIQQVSDALRACCRAHDVLCRVGGEEFVVILFDTEPALLQSIAERIRLYIAQMPIKLQHQHISVTVSIGATEAAQASQLHDNMKQADLALYQAKANGRNCVVFATPSMSG